MKVVSNPGGRSYHYYNPETKLNVMTKTDGNFISGWKLSDTQSSDLIGNGNVF
ncbi:hypothetical protein D8B20_02445 [Candidatus Pantoea soli]|uniref:Uncharacterized protein n=1 Tax=Candidatus Pantoea soli TaxID=3098669 RepID=A0A518X9H7_9GAMM|nr:hypothetical protein D8B20_02445 [Pantoea soli]